MSGAPENTPRWDRFTVIAIAALMITSFAGSLLELSYNFLGW